MKSFNLSPCKYLQASFCLFTPLFFAGCNSAPPPAPPVLIPRPPRPTPEPTAPIATPAPLPKAAFVIPKSNVPKPNGYDALVKAGQSLQPELPANSNLAQQKAHVQKNATALQALQKAMQLPIVAPPQRGLVGTKLYHAEMRKLARALTERARVQADAGNFNAAVQSGLDAVELGAAIQNGGNKLTMLTGIAIEQIGNHELWKWRENVNAQQAAQAARRLAQIELRHSGLAAMESEEKWQALSTLRQITRESDWEKFRQGKVKGWDTAFKDPNDRARLRKLSYPQIEANLMAKMDAAIASAKLPYAPNAPRLNSAADPLSNLLTGSAGSPRSRLVYENTRAENRLLMTAFALQAFVKTGGQYPPTLNALVPKYLKAVPRDPFAPTKPLVYKLSGRTYMLYSVGLDGKDNGGTPIKTRGISVDSVGDIAVGFGKLR